MQKNVSDGVLKCRRALATLPLANLATLQALVEFLDEVRTHADANKMTLENLAVVFAPILLQPRTDNPVVLMQSAPIGRVMCAPW